MGDRLCSTCAFPLAEIRHEPLDRSLHDLSYISDEVNKGKEAVGKEEEGGKEARRKEEGTRGKVEEGRNREEEKEGRKKEEGKEQGSKSEIEMAVAINNPRRKRQQWKDSLDVYHSA